MGIRDNGRPGRSYQQHCPIARTLDVIGERWTLLIVRDLLVGPKRYKDLLVGLPRIGTNLLAARLRELEERGIIQRRALPPPAGSSVYELSDVGQALEPVIMAMGHWGVRYLPAPPETDVLLPSAFFVGLRAVFRADAAADLVETYELRINNQVFEVRVADGRCTTIQGRTSHPNVVMTLDMETLHALLTRKLSAVEALDSGQVKVMGDLQALDRFVRIFRLGRAEQAEVRQTSAEGL